MIRIKSTKFQIRRCLETNSSASHAFSIGQTETDEDLSKFKDSVVFSSGGRYGWGPDVLSTFQEKLDYLCQMSVISSVIEDYIRNAIKERLNSILVLNIPEDNYVDNFGQYFTEEEVYKILFRKDSYIYVLNDNGRYYVDGDELCSVNVKYRDYRYKTDEESFYSSVEIFDKKGNLIYSSKIKEDKDLVAFIDTLPNGLKEFVGQSLL